MKTKMKNTHVLFIVENAVVPYDVRVWREAKAIKDSKYQVSIISPKGGNSKETITTIDGIKIYRYPSVLNRRGFGAIIFEYINALFWQFIFSLFIYILNPFKIIHAANPPDTIFIVGLLFKLFGVKYIFDHHDLSPELYEVKFLPKRNLVYKSLILFEKISCKFADVIISTNESYKQIVIERHKIDPHKITIVRNDPYVRQRPMKLNRGSLYYIFYIGSINKQDGVDILIKAINILVHDLNRINIKCTVVGDGDALNSAKQLVLDFGLLDYVFFTGFVLNKDKIYEYFKSSDICVEPAPDNNLNYHSTFIKIMEYMSFCKPIVAFDLSETRYSAMDSALFVNPGDTKGFAEAIERLIIDDHLSEELGEAGYNRVKQKLNWQNSTKSLKKLYTSLIKH